MKVAPLKHLFLCFHHKHPPTARPNSAQEMATPFTQLFSTHIWWSSLTPLSKSYPVASASIVASTAPVHRKLSTSSHLQHCPLVEATHRHFPCLLSLTVPPSTWSHTDLLTMLIQSYRSLASPLEEKTNPSSTSWPHHPGFL